MATANKKTMEWKPNMMRCWLLAHKPYKCREEGDILQA